MSTKGRIQPKLSKEEQYKKSPWPLQENNNNKNKLYYLKRKERISKQRFEELTCCVMQADHVLIDKDGCRIKERVHQHSRGVIRK
jgi:hypothetical protein